MFAAIVWASDGSVDDDRSLPVVREICARYGAALRIVHVVERLPGPSWPGVEAHAREDRVVAKLKARTSALRGHGISASLHVVRGTLGQTADHIADVATAGNAQLIVAGARGRSAREGAMLGSVTQRLLAVASCPVLVIPVQADGRRPRAGRRGPVADHRPAGHARRRTRPRP